MTEFEKYLQQQIAHFENLMIYWYRKYELEKKEEKRKFYYREYEENRNKMFLIKDNLKMYQHFNIKGC